MILIVDVDVFSKNLAFKVFVMDLEGIFNYHHIETWLGKDSIKSSGLKRKTAPWIFTVEFWHSSV